MGDVESHSNPALVVECNERNDNSQEKTEIIEENVKEKDQQKRPVTSPAAGGKK